MDHLGLTRPVRCDASGSTGPTPGQARGRAYRRTSRGLYVPAHVSDAVPEQRILEASTAVPDGAVTGWAGLRWLGAWWFGGLDSGGHRKPVAVACRHKHLPRAGILVSQEGWLPDSDLVELDGVRVTSAARSVYFEMRHATSLLEATIALDMACYADLVTIAEMTAYVACCGPRTGVDQARRAVALADENSWSPQETATRLSWQLRAGLGPLLCNRPVFDLDGRLVGTPDLLDEEAGLAIDYDGAVHLGAAQRRADRTRADAFHDVGLDRLVVLGGDLPTDASAERMRRARARAAARHPGTRGWTVVPPPSWTPTHTVEARRALDEATRSRVLRYRLAG